MIGVLLAALLAAQEVPLPAPAPATCRLAGEQVDRIAWAQTFHRYVSAEDRDASEWRKRELGLLAKVVTVRFGKAKFDRSTNLFLFSNFPNETAIDFAQACLALPEPERSHAQARP
ncbi:MAG: hypothetical protein V4574_01555 [Pseudomonadota bacterium]